MATIRTVFIRNDGARQCECVRRQTSFALRYDGAVTAEPPAPRCADCPDTLPDSAWPAILLAQPWAPRRRARKACRR